MLPNGHLLLTGAHDWASVLLEYDPAAANTGKVVQARRLETYQYSSIPYGYDLPSCALRQNAVYTLTDNFKLSRVDAAQPDPAACQPEETMHALELGPQTLGVFVPEFGTITESSDVILTSQPVTTTGELSCGVVNVAEAPSARAFTVFPSPATGAAATVRLQVARSGDFHCRLLDSQGKVMFNRHVFLPAGQTSFEISLPAPTGIYYLALTGAERFITQKIVKIN